MERSTTILQLREHPSQQQEEHHGEVFPSGSSFILAAEVAFDSVRTEADYLEDTQMWNEEQQQQTNQQQQQQQQQQHGMIVPSFTNVPADGSGAAAKVAEDSAYTDADYLMWSSQSEDIDQDYC
jgi:hypothetical protein